MKNITIKRRVIMVEPGPGSNIANVLREAAIVALTEDADVSFEFNDTAVSINPDKLLGPLWLEWNGERK